MFEEQYQSAAFFVDHDHNMTLNYALGSVKGTYAQEQLCFQHQQICLPHATEFLLVSESENCENYVTSGFLGLAPHQSSVAA